MKKSEGKIQQECVIWFRNNNLKTSNLIFSVPNEGKSAAEQMYKKALGMMSGVSDTIIIMQNKVIFCEFKDDHGKQSDKQIIFQNKVENLGFEYWLIRNLEDFKNKLK
jgi:hypothetical protein